MEDSGSSDLGSNPGGTTNRSFEATHNLLFIRVLGQPKTYISPTFRVA